MTEPEREVYHDTPPTAEELKGNAHAYCYHGIDVWPLRPLTTEAQDSMYIFDGISNSALCRICQKHYLDTKGHMANGRCVHTIVAMEDL